MREVLQHLPVTFKDAKVVHFHGAKQGAEFRSCLKLWFNHVSSPTPLTPPRSGSPPAADIAIITPRCEIAPVVLALYLLSAVPFALLLPVDLVDMARCPGIFPDAPHEKIGNRLAAAGKLVILQAQMTWILGNVPACRPVEVFSNQLRTPAPVTGFQEPMPEASGPVVDDCEFVEGTVPRTLEAWIHAQQIDEEFVKMLEDVEDKALRQELWIRATPHDNPTIIVPRSYQEILVRDTHHRMFHLAYAKVFALLRCSYYWKSMKTDVREILEDCPQCELNKARQNTAHGLFSAAPAHAPRAKWCMDFQGQGTALTEETEALALIDPISRYVVVIPLKDHEASNWIQPFLDRIVFTFGPADVLHSDAAPEFLSEALALVAKATDISLDHHYLGTQCQGKWDNPSLLEVWNHCLRFTIFAR